MPSSITIVWNRAQTVSDEVWRTLDGKALHPFVVALSERHVGLVEDLMTERFGVAWAETKAIAGRVAKRESRAWPPTWWPSSPGGLWRSRRPSLRKRPSSK